MTEEHKENTLFLIICLIAIYLNMQVWMHGLSLPLKILSFLLSNLILAMFLPYLKPQGKGKK